MIPAQPRMVAVWLVLLTLALLPAAAHAQPMRFHNLQGKIVAIAGNVIQWTDPTNAEMYVQVDARTKVKVTGTADPSVLAPGMYVRFGAEISKRGKILNDLDELTIFTPGDGFTTGVFEDGLVDPKAASARYFVAGQIESVKNGLYSIETGEDSFKVKLSADSKINIDVPDISIARADDEITITGRGEAKNQIVASELEVKLAAPLAAAEKPGKRPVKSRKPSRGKAAARPAGNDADVPDFEASPDFQ
ncbi:MAG: hypothetical protein JNG90_13040 [Planctomycetaceae bacterium]|nr:hypothetical protein [Planctomycetaceae bacterium]